MGPPPARPRHQHMAKRSGARTALLGCFSVIVVLFAWHNSAYLSAWARANSLARANSGVRASRQRQGLESPRMSYLGLQAGEGTTLWDGDGDGDGGDPDLAREQQELEPDEDSEQPWAASGSAADPVDAAAAAAAGAASKPTGAGAGSRPAEAAAGAAGGGLSGNAGSKPAAQRQQQQRQGQGQQGARQRPAVPKPTPLTPLEQQQVALQASLATQLDREHAALLGGGARHEPPAPRVYAPARRPTLVLYAYLGADYEHEERLGFFVRSAVREGDGAVYKIILAHPGVKKPAGLPELPSNAQFLRPSSGCNDTWGAIAGVLPRLRLERFDYVVVVDSLALGPFLPSYASQVLHWTEPLTRKLVGDVKMVGSFITCEGTPKGGEVAAEWRLNPYVLPHAWATDKAGMQLLMNDTAVMSCHEGYWDARYRGDSGAALALLQAGYNLDTLMLRYQGIDWRHNKEWGCNARVRPDGAGMYDGIQPSPYEVMFLPLSMAEAQHRLVLRTAARYTEWAAPEGGVVNLTRNEYNGQQYEGDWAVRGRKVLLLEKRWSCFDTGYYVEHNPDLADLPNKTGEEAMGLWDHFVAFGQFQGRVHRFVCGEPEPSREDSVRLLLQRGRACFDAAHYKTQWKDLGHLTTPKELWLHYVRHGQFEGRTARYVCPETMGGLVRGLDGTPMVQLNAEGQALLKEPGLGLEPSDAAQRRQH